MIFADRGAGRVSAFDAQVTMPGNLTAATLQAWKTELVLVVRRRADERAVEDLLRREVERMDRAASRFREDSEISRINQQDGRWVTVSAYLGEVLEAALEAAELTDGLVNPCMGAAVDAAGYRIWRDGASAVSRSDVSPESDLLTAWEEVEVRSEGSQVKVRIPAGMVLDVGAVAKGWLADRLAMLAAERFACGALANMGGDVRVVTGERGWDVAVDPQVPGVAPQALELWDAGLATSSTGRRRWTTSDGTVAHHIIDPRTGSPAVAAWTTCAVLAATTAEANAASTAGLILGERGPEWIQDQGLDAWFVGEDGSQMRTGRWPEPGQPV